MDGTYTLAAPIIVTAFVSPHLVVIQGNTANPANCKLMAPSDCSASAGYMFLFTEKTFGVVLQGFQLQGSSSCSVIFVQDGYGDTSVILGQLHIMNTPNAIVVGEGAFAYAQYVAMTNTAAGSSTAVTAQNGGQFGFGVGCSISGFLIGITANNGMVVVDASVAISSVTLGLNCIGGYCYTGHLVNYPGITGGANVGTQTNCAAGYYN